VIRHASSTITSGSGYHSIRVVHVTAWTSYIPSFEALGRMLAIPMPQAIERIRKVTADGIFQGLISRNEAFAVVAEETWNSLGRPSYRVALPLATALTETRLNIDEKFLYFPHEVFAVDIPSGLDIRNNDGNRLLGLLVGRASRADLRGPRGDGPQLVVTTPRTDGSWNLIILQTWENAPSPSQCFVTLTPDSTVEERLNVPLDGAEQVTPSTDDKTTRQMISLAIGAALFAVSANSRFVKPIHRHSSKHSKRKAANRPPEPRRWSLGADIRLPNRPSATAATGNTGDGLQWAHLRQGHLRLTPCGPLDSRHYELRYIAPTIVRPDLPMVPAATRHTLESHV